MPAEPQTPHIPLPEYPRPQMVRSSYINLNGAWQYAITGASTAPQSWDGEITVPYSPECALSGVQRMVNPHNFLWYRRVLVLPQGFNAGRVLLHFGAVDQCCTVFINGQNAGAHSGGYTAFTLDITPYLADENEIMIRVTDVSDTAHYSRGKQKIKRGKIWYTPQSGIWQTVWAESVPQQYIERVVITPLFDESAVCVTAFTHGSGTVTVQAQGKTATGKPGEKILLPLDSFIAWTPETPHLYDMTVGFETDSVDTYFAMRKFSVEKDSEGTPRIFLNGRPYFHNGVLDQGYWQSGLYTPPSDEAMIYDITYMKRLGFNMLRKHIKIEPMRWYYHCDRLGMLVWQDMINGGGQYSAAVITTPLVLGSHIKDSHYRLLARADKAGRAQYKQELREMLVQLQSVPCIAVWVPFNEGWGQFDAAETAAEAKAFDPTRLVDHASGWYDQKAGDFKSLHVYFRPYRYRKDKHGRAVVLSEFGGYALGVAGHTFTAKDYGYKTLPDTAALTRSFIQLYEQQIIPAKAEGLCAAVYTQLSDVEDEVNGFVTYDRKVEKISPAEVRAVLEKLQDTPLKATV